MSKDSSDSAGRDRIADLEAAVTRLTEEVARLRTSSQAQRSDADQPEAAAPRHEGAAEANDVVSRRNALRKAGFIAAGAVVGGGAIAAAAAMPAAAASPDTTVSGTGSPGGSFSGFGGDGVDASTITTGKSAVWAHTATTGSYGVFAEHDGQGEALYVLANNDTTAGIIVQNGTGECLAISGNSSSTSSLGVLVENVEVGAQLGGTRYGAELGGNQAGLYFFPSHNAPYPPAEGFTTVAGELTFDANLNLWLCVYGGSPGTLRLLAGQASAGSFIPLPTPVRVYDSRPTTQPPVSPKSPLIGGQTRVLDMTVNSSTVPPGATVIVLSILLVNATSGNGNFTVWANGQDKPLSNTLVWGGSAGRFSTTAISALDDAAMVQVEASLNTDLVVDVIGYYH